MGYRAMFYPRAHYAVWALDLMLYNALRWPGLARRYGEMALDAAIDAQRPDLLRRIQGAMACL